MKKLVALLVVVGLLCFLVPGAYALDGPDATVTRISGSNRFATAAAISAQNRSYSGYAVLARGDHYADALAGVSLAAMYEAPILLTPQGSLAPETKAELLELGAHTVIILGGTGAVGKAVEDELVKMGLVVERLKGSNRYATAAAIAERVAPSGSYSAVVASGMDYPDALAAASYAGSLGYPILLTEKDKLPAETAAALDKLAVAETVLVGGSAVVSDGVMNLLPGAVRIRGANRVETSVALARHFGPSLDTMFVASGRGFADAITGAALAARMGSGLLLVDKDVPTAISAYFSENPVGAVTILGGTGAVSQTVMDTLVDTLSLAGKKVEFLSSSVMTALPGGGEALRYPYAGYVTKVLGSSGDYIKIQYGSKAGWVPKDALQLTEREEDYPRVSWQFIQGSDTRYVQSSPDVSGYNVFAPVMYTVGSSSVSIIPGQNFSSAIAIARQNGYKIWLTVQEFGTSPNFKEVIVDGIISAALAQDADGINIDYEGMGESNQDGFTNFMSRLYPKAKAHGLVVSVDVTRHASNRYGLSYDRAALAKYCDYMALMAYDEHWSTSPLSGSTASMPWTASGIRLLLNEVPAEKVLLGMPFYTRNWRYDDSVVAVEDMVMMMEVMRLRTEPFTSGGSATVIKMAEIGETYTYLGEVEGEDVMGETTWYMIDVDGQTGYVTGYSGYTSFVPQGETYGGSGLSSYALPMQASLDIITYFDPVARTSQFTTRSGNLVTMRNVQIVEDDPSGQTMVSYVDDQNRLNEIWLEDYNSLRKRYQLMQEYNLGGLAAWSLEWIDDYQQAWIMLQN